jgi:hypothetical protein
MSNPPQIASRLREIVRRYNRELALDALLKALLGIAFSFLVFGLLFWGGWFVGIFFARSLNLHAWQFGAFLSGLFLVTALWSAWQRVDPLAGLQRLSEKQLLLTLISQDSSQLLYFSPRHATAGVAILLIGGPANLFQAFGIWTSRLRADESLLEESARLLAACDPQCAAEQVRKPTAALLLRRLALIKVVPGGDSPAFALTEKGSTVVSGAKAGGGKRSTGSSANKVKRRCE